MTTYGIGGGRKKDHTWCHTTSQNSTSVCVCVCVAGGKVWGGWGVGGGGGWGAVKTLRPRQNGRHFPDDIMKCIFLNENARISLKISLKFVPKVRINNIPALVQIMAWRRPGDKPLSEPMIVSLLTHICVTWPQWVKFNGLSWIVGNEVHGIHVIIGIIILPRKNLSKRNTKKVCALIMLSCHKRRQLYINLQSISIFILRRPPGASEATPNKMGIPITLICGEWCYKHNKSCVYFVGCST